MNRICNLTWLASVLVMLLGLGACSDDAKTLLSTVPADSYVVVTVNGDELLARIDYKNEEGKTSFCPEMESLLKTAGADPASIRKIADGVDLTDKIITIFGCSWGNFMTFTVTDASHFRKWYEAATEKSFTDEGGGFYGLSSKDFVMKDKQVWVSLDGKIETSQVEKFLALDKKDRFNEKYPETSSAMADAGKLIAGFFNIDEGLSLLRKNGDTEDAAQIQLTLGMIFKDVAYVSFEATVDSDKAVSSLRMLTKDEKPAEFLIPMSKINTAAMNKVDNTAFCVGAIDISPDLTKMLEGLIKNYGSAMNPEDRAVLTTFLGLKGTSSCSINGANDVLLSLGFNSNAKAAEAGNFFAQFGAPVRVNTAGDFLLLSMGDNAKAAGSAPKGFGDAYLALYFDYTNPAMKEYVPFDLSEMGNMLVTLEPDGKGVQLKSVWRVKKPICTALKLANTYLGMLQGFGSYNEADSTFELDPDATDIEY